MQRNHFIDVLKLVASFFVICIHTKTTAKIDGFEQDSFSFIVDNIARFAVPFFFITSGYLINFKNNKRLLKRLGIIFITYLLWSGIFTFIRNYNDLSYPVFVFSETQSTNLLLNRMYKLTVFGYERHLWYFPAYIVGVLMVKLLNRNIIILIVLAVIMYVLGITGQQLRFVYPQHVDFLLQPVQQWLHETYFTRSGLFFAFPFIAIGYTIKHMKPYITGNKVLLLGGLSVGLFIVQYYECIYFINQYNTTSADYYFTTPLLASCILLISISKPQVGGKLSWITRLSGGVYLLHPLFMYLFLIQFNTLFEESWFPYAFTIILFALSLITAWLISLIRPLRALIFYQ